MVVNLTISSISTKQAITFHYTLYYTHPHILFYISSLVADDKKIQIMYTHYIYSTLNGNWKPFILSAKKKNGIIIVDFVYYVYLLKK